MVGGHTSIQVDDCLAGLGEATIMLPGAPRFDPCTDCYSQGKSKSVSYKMVPTCLASSILYIDRYIVLRISSVHLFS